MIYLFCNEGYGAPYIAAAQDYVNRKSAPVTLVFSHKGQRSLSIIQALRKIWRQINASKHYGLNIICAEDINDASFTGRIKEGDHGIVTGFNQIFKAEIISKFTSLVNFHPSLLPFYRGPVPSYWCIKNGEEKTGYTLHYVTESIDNGEILFQHEVAIEGITDEAVLDRKIAERGAQTFLRYLDHLWEGGDWSGRKLDAHKVYKTHVRYKSFADKELD